MKKFNYYYDYSPETYNYIMSSKILRQSEKNLLKAIGEFAEEYPCGKYAISTNGHLSAILDGYVMDTFDPRNRVMRCAWRIR